MTVGGKWGYTSVSGGGFHGAIDKVRKLRSETSKWRRQMRWN